MPGLLSLLKKADPSSAKSSISAQNDPLADQGLHDPLTGPSLGLAEASGLVHKVSGPTSAHAVSAALEDSESNPVKKDVPLPDIDEEDEEEIDNEALAALQGQLAQLQDQLDLPDDLKAASNEVKLQLAEAEDDTVDSAQDEQVEDEDEAILDGLTDDVLADDEEQESEDDGILEEIADEVLAEADPEAQQDDEDDGILEEIADEVLADGEASGPLAAIPEDAEIDSIPQSAPQDAEEIQQAQVEAEQVEAEQDDAQQAPDKGVGAVDFRTNRFGQIKKKNPQQHMETAALDPALQEAVSLQHPSLGTTLKGQMNGAALGKMALNAVPLVAPVRNGLGVRHEHRKAKAMENLKIGLPKADGFTNMAIDTTKGRARTKRNVKGVSAGIGLATSALSATGVGTGAAVLADLTTNAVADSLGGAASAALGEVAASGASMGGRYAVNASTELGTFLTDKNKTKLKRTKVLDAQGHKHLMGDYKTNRAMLYHLGMGARDQDALDAKGSTDEQEKSRLSLKESLGASADMDLHARKSRVVKRKFGKDKQDFLSEAERDTYEKLKRGEIKGSKVPKEHILPILWEANKLFTFHEKVVEARAKQAQKAA